MTTKAINIIFDGPPSNNPGRFVKVETDDGHCINAGEWIEREDGLWALRITALPEDDNVTSVWMPQPSERLKELLLRMVTVRQFPGMSCSEGHELVDEVCELLDIEF